MMFLTDEELETLSPVKRMIYERRIERWKNKIGKERIPICLPYSGRGYMVSAGWLSSMPQRMAEKVSHEALITFADYMEEVQKYVLDKEEKKVQSD